MRPFWEEVRATKRLGLRDLNRDISRITSLIRKRLGQCDDAVVIRIVEDVLPYHIHAVVSGMRDDDSLEYAALAMGEDLREAVAEARGALSR
jgi:hypothetical protein